MSIDSSYSKIFSNLYVGGLTAYHFLNEDGIPYQRWLQCAKELKSSTLPFIPVPLEDGPLTEESAQLIEWASDAVAEFLSNELTVLVSCAEGRNRSCVVAARALQKLGYKDVIQLLRERRHSSALTNKEFEEYIRRFE